MVVQWLGSNKSPYLWNDGIILIDLTLDYQIQVSIVQCRWFSSLIKVKKKILCGPKKGDKISDRISWKPRLDSWIVPAFILCFKSVSLHRIGTWRPQGALISVFNNIVLQIMCLFSAVCMIATYKIKNKLKSLKVAKWGRMNEEWWMKDELGMLKDEGCVMKDEGFKLLRGFASWRTDERTDERTDICECRVAFATEK